MGTFVYRVPLGDDVEKRAVAKRRDMAGTPTPRAKLSTEISGAAGPRSAVRCQTLQHCLERVQDLLASSTIVRAVNDGFGHPQ